MMCFVYFYVYILFVMFLFFFFFKQKTAYEMRISDWSSDVCSSDLPGYNFGMLRLETERLDCPTRLGTIRQNFRLPRSEERRVGKECAVRVDLGGRCIIKKKNSELAILSTRRYAKYITIT